MTRSAAVTVRRPGARTTPATRTKTWRQTAVVKEDAKGCTHAASTSGTLVGMAQASAWGVDPRDQPLPAEGALWPTRMRCASGSPPTPGHAAALKSYERTAAIRCIAGAPVVRLRACGRPERRTMCRSCGGGARPGPRRGTSAPSPCRSIRRSISSLPKASSGSTPDAQSVTKRAKSSSEAEPFWKAFLRSLADRGLRGVKLVIADDHKGLRAAAAKVFHATHQRCRVHWMRNALAHVPPKQRPAVVALLKTIFAQDTAEVAHAQWKQVADTLRERFSRLAELRDGSRDDVLAYMAFPREHWAQIASTNPLERLNGEIKRRADVIGIFPNDRAVVRLIGALMLEQNDEWAVSRRYMSLESLASLSDDPVLRLSTVAA